MKRITEALGVLIFLIICSNEVFAQKEKSSLMKMSENYQKYNLVPNTNIPEKWEDGIRTTGQKGTFEWWYFDGHLKDSSTIVIVFYTKPMINLNQKLQPMVSLDITKPDGSKILKEFECKPEDFFASKDSCNVQIGKNYFVGNLKEYKIHLEDEEIKLTANIKRTTESWRPKTGFLVFGKDESKEFSWVVPVPQGEVDLTYEYQGETIHTEGSCYHDHNWGNYPMNSLFNHWYWSRAEIGPYNIIASETVSEKEFNNETNIVFNISKDGKTIEDRGEYVTLYRSYGKMHSELNKDISDNLIFIYDNPADEYRYEYSLYREKTIHEVDLLEKTLGGGIKYRMAKLFTKNRPAYFRFTGKAEIKVYKNNQLIENHISNSAIWELMYYGKPNGGK